MRMPVAALDHSKLDMIKHFPTVHLNSHNAMKPVALVLEIKWACTTTCTMLCILSPKFSLHGVWSMPVQNGAVYNFVLHSSITTSWPAFKCIYGPHDFQNASMAINYTILAIVALFTASLCSILYMYRKCKISTDVKL